MKRFFVALMILSLIMSPCDAFAKGGGGGGGRSGGGGGGARIGGGGGGGMRTSAPSGRSYSTSSVPKSSGRTYSTGSTSSSAPKYTSTPKPTAPVHTSPPKSTAPAHTYTSTAPKTTAPSGKTYSSSSEKPVTSTPPAPKTTAPSGKTYSSSASTEKVASTPPKSNPSTGPPAGKTYTNNAVEKPAAAQVANSSSDGASRKPTNSTFNKDLSNSAKKEESKAKYVAATTPAPTPKPTYKTPGPNGVEKPIQANSPQVQTVRRYVTHERYVTYDHRVSSFYGPYYGQPYYYHDSFSPFLMGWLLSDAINSQQRALWMYNHQYDMDASRYNEMLRRDARLQAEIDALKAQNVVRNPAYIPPQMEDNPDVMYNKEFVDASYNPQEVPVTPAPQSQLPQSQPSVVVHHSNGGSVIFWIVIIAENGNA